MSKKVWHTVTEVANITGYGRQQVGYFIRPPFRIQKKNFKKTGNKFLIRMPAGAIDIKNNVSVRHTKNSKSKPELLKYLKSCGEYKEQPIEKEQPTKKSEKPTDSEKKETIKSAGLTIVPLAEAQELKENYIAALKKIELKEKQGEYLKKEDVEKDAFSMARIIRDAILNIPDRISAELASIKDIHVISEKLTSELTECLEELSS